MHTTIAYIHNPIVYIGHFCISLLASVHMMALNHLRLLRSRRVRSQQSYCCCLTCCVSDRGRCPHAVPRPRGAWGGRAASPPPQATLLPQPHRDTSQVKTNTQTFSAFISEISTLVVLRLAFYMLAI